ncbi:hypothetical protein KKG61_00170 [bacterium]|nr:hypothetical protein [bacterium]
MSLASSACYSKSGPLKSVVKVNPETTTEYEYYPETGDYKIYYTGYNGERKYYILEPKDKIVVYVKSEVEFDPDSGTYKYSYGVISGASSVQDIESFGIVYDREKVSVTTLISPNDDWFEGFHITFPYWDWAYVGADKGGIEPDTSVTGFSAVGSGLPGIVNCYADGYAELWTFSNYEGEIAASQEDIFLYENSDETNLLEYIPTDLGVAGKTVGPIAPLEVFEPLSFLDNLVSLKEQAYSLGWIDNKGILNSLDQKLEAAKKNIQKGKINTAKNILEAFINEVEAQKEKHLSSEAYALLKFNAQYLIENL